MQGKSEDTFWQYLRMMFLSSLVVTGLALMFQLLGSSGQTLAADTDNGPAIYNYNGTTAVPDLITSSYKDGGQLSHRIWYTAGNKDNTKQFVSTNSSEMASRSIIDIDNYSNLAVHYFMKNTGSTQINLWNFITLPAYSKIKNPTTVPTVVYSKNEAIPSENIETSGNAGNSVNIGYSFTDGNYDSPTLPTGKNWSDLLGVRLSGKLDPGATYEVTIPLSLTNESETAEHLSDRTIVNRIICQDLPYDLQATYLPATYSTASFDKPMPAADNPITSTKKYVVVTNKGNGNYEKVPADVQALVPNMNSNGEISIRNFDKPFTNDGPETAYYTGAIYRIDLSKFTSLTTNGYSFDIDPATKKPRNFYSYNTTPLSDPITDPTTGKPWTEGDDYGPAYLSVRQVIDAKNVTIPIGTKWDATKYATVYDHDGNKVDLTDKSLVTITESPAVNTSKNGIYQVKYTYIPDGVSKTITVTVGNGSGTPGGGGSSTGTITNSGSTTTNPGSTTGSTTGTTTGTTTSGSTGVNISNPSTYAFPFKVYAKTAIYKYKTPNFKKSQRGVKYTKKPRVYAPTFKVTKAVKDSHGNWRYKVAGGYITANTKNVALLYWQSKKYTKLYTINPKGAYEYKSQTFAKKNRVKHLKKGTVVKVTGIIHHGMATRYVLTNGNYITGNKQYVSPTKF